LFIVTFDPDRPENPPMLRCFNYANRPMELRWSIETNIDFLESEDQLTVTYLPKQEIIVNNSLYGHLSAYVERNDGQAEQLWSTRETIGPDVAAYIASATQPDGTLYFVENFSRTLFALDGETGAVLWSHEIPSQSIKTPIPHQGRLYVDHNYGMVALGAE
jgi:outer membrane protein assembly factor BamB